jgi:hypothetical protein
MTAIDPIVELCARKCEERLAHLKKQIAVGNDEGDGGYMRARVHEAATCLAAIRALTPDELAAVVKREAVAEAYPDLWILEDGYNAMMKAETPNGEDQRYVTKEDYDALLRRSEHCMCDACKNGIIHDSCCAVHNMPASANAECNCRAAPVAPVEGKEEALTWEQEQELRSYWLIRDVDECVDEIVRLAKVYGVK